MYNFKYYVKCATDDTFEEAFSLGIFREFQIITEE